MTNTTVVDPALLRADSRDERRSELSTMSYNKGVNMFSPANGRELMDMSNLMAGAGAMVKDTFRNNPGACMGLIAICQPYGLNPLQVSWKAYSTKQNGPIAFEAQVIVAMVNASGVVKGGLRYHYEGEGQNRQCVCRGTLKGEAEPLEVWSPPLKQISPQNSPLWKTDPDQQLAYYTGRSWARRYKPEMLLGVYDVDEMEPAAVGPDQARNVTPTAPRRGGVVYRDEPKATIAPDPAQDAAGEPEGWGQDVQDAETVGDDWNRDAEVEPDSRTPEEIEQAERDELDKWDAQQAAE